MDKAVFTVAVPREGHRGGHTVASVYQTSFTRAIFSNLYAIAISNILVFMLDAPPIFLGVASALNAFACFLGPFIFHRLSNRAGVKNTLRFISVVDIVVLLLVACIPEPGVMIAAFIIDGIGNCMFWANLVTAIRAWQDVTPQSTRERTYRLYGLSWIVGGLVGELLGFIIIAIGFDDRFVYAMSIIFAVVQLYVSNRVIVPERKLATVNERCDPTNHPATRTSTMRRPGAHSRVESSKIRAIGRIILAPLGLMVIAEIAIQMIRGTFDFLYPFVMREDGGSTGWVYLMSMVQRLAFMLGIFTSSKQGVRGQHLGALMSLGIVALLTVNVINSPGPAMFTIALVISSLASGMIYGYSSHVLLRYEHHGDALKLASFYEAVSGMGYGVMVVVSGIGGEGNMQLVFIGLTVFLVVAFAIFTLASFNRKITPHHEPGMKNHLAIIVIGQILQDIPLFVNLLPRKFEGVKFVGVTVPVSTAKK